MDLGGTLLDTSDPLGWSEVAASVGITVEPDHLAHAFRELEAGFDARGFPPLEEFWRQVLEKSSGQTVSSAAASAYCAGWDQRERPPPLFSDARHCLETLRDDGLPLGIVSNSRGEGSVRELLGQAKIDAFFAVVVSSGTEGVRKPDPEIFHRATSRLGVQPGEAVHVGDLAYTDAKGAIAAGLHGVWLNRHGWGFGEDPPEITSLTELPAFVRGLGAAPLK
jgi:HAD superfamily hydrolase (TIGR01662 family)